ncbi:MAG: hypothetical protein JST42_27345 [Bacteroidetes bacterium]|nr:hypothetical protein [Bacteroidota bacterium]
MQRIVISGVLSGLLFLGCRSGAARGFSFSVPSGWKKIDTVLAGIRLTAALSPDTAGQVRPNVSVTTAPADGASLDTYFDANLRRITGSVARFRMIGKGERSIGGMRSRWVDFTGQMANKVELEQRLYIVVEDRTAYLITCTAANGRWSRDEWRFNQVLDSFTIN